MILGRFFNQGIQLPSDAQKWPSKCVNPPNSVRRSLRVPLEYDISSQRDDILSHSSNTPEHPHGAAD